VTRWKYLLATLGLFGLELAIALFVHDLIIRPFVGDVLVVVLIYCAVQTVCLAPPNEVAGAVLALACLVETLQAFDYARWLGAEPGTWQSVVLGRTFSWWDFAAYTLGYSLIGLAEGQNKPGGNE
jgi:hypothetical protein